MEESTMAVNNSLTKKSESTGVIEYQSGGQLVKLSPAMIKKYLVSGGGNVSDSEVMMFLSLCKFQQLNPFLHEAYLIKFGNSPATMVVGKDVFIKRASRNHSYDGKQAGIIVQERETGKIIEREGEFYIDSEEKLVGGWAKVWIKGHSVPEYAAVSMAEYAGRKSNGELNNQWATKPATMLRKVALVHALREAFPEELCGLYAPEETPQASEIVLDDPAPVEPVQIPAQETAQESAELPAPAEDIQGALFG
jgi:phage recombination protein Bet